MTTNVFVIDSVGRPCLPCCAARARKLLASDKAKMYSVAPFTIQLTYEITNPVGSFTVGIDDGAKYVGIAVVNETTKTVVFRGEIRLRQDVSRMMLQRKMYRRMRRNRNLRYRPARFSNRGQKGWIPPTIRQKKDSILRVVVDLKKRLNIAAAVVEQGMFDTSSLAKGRHLIGTEFQQSDYEGEEFRAKVLWRDKYTCQRPGCGEDQCSVQAHHIVWRSKGGTDTVGNGITLCRECHDALHRGAWQLTQKPKHFKYPAHLQCGKRWLFDGLGVLGLQTEVCFGWMTKKWRLTAGLKKSHSNDASAMVCRGYFPVCVAEEYAILPKRRKIWESNPTKTCTEKNGFRHWDLVRATHQTRGIVIGSVRSLKAKVLTLRTSWDRNFSVSYSKSSLLYRFDGLVYVRDTQSITV